MPSPGVVRPLIAVVSCRAYADRQRACQETWVPELLLQHGIPSIFVVGDPDLDVPSRFDAARNLLTLRVADDYASLTEKSFALFEWFAKETRFTHLVKCDDDTYVLGAALVRALERDVPFAGHRLQHSDGTVYASGSGYILQRSVVDLLAEDREELDEYFEDVAVGRALARHGVTLSGFRALPLGHGRSDSIHLDGLWNPAPHAWQGTPFAHLQRMPADAQWSYHRIAMREIERPVTPRFSAFDRTTPQERAELRGQVVTLHDRHWVLLGNSPDVAALAAALVERGATVASERGFVHADGVGVESDPDTAPIARPVAGILLLSALDSEPIQRNVPTTQALGILGEATVWPSEPEQQQTVMRQNLALLQAAEMVLVDPGNPRLAGELWELMHGR